MKITVDARMINHGGIGTYLRHLLPHLKEKIDLKILESTTPLYSLKEQFLLRKQIPPCDIFWSPHFNAPFWKIKGSHIVTIHDMYHLDHFKTLSISKQLYVKTVLRKVILNADRLITVSIFSKKRILHYFPEVQERVELIHLGSDHLMQCIPEPVKGVPDRFFLCVGNAKPHKNREVIFKALKAFPNKHIVIVGPGVGSRNIHVRGAVTDRELSWLYRNAEGLIFPSLYEGWGLPPLEAMSLGCPVIASSAASIPEACGEGALYFDPCSAEQLCERIEELSHKQKELIAIGKKHAAQFTWRAAADKHLGLFRNLLRGVSVGNQ